MKNIRIIALVVCVFMMAAMVVSCDLFSGSEATTTTTTTTSGAPAKPTGPLNVFDSYGESFADGFSSMVEGEVVVEEGVIKVDNTLGCYHVMDDELVLNYDNYSSIVIEFDMEFTAFPAKEMASIVSPLFWVDEEIFAQFFFKVSSTGALYYHAQGKWAQPITNNGVPMSIELNKSYHVKIEYDIGYGDYVVYLDDVWIANDILEVIMDEDVTQFTIRFFDSNKKYENYSATITDATITAEP